MGLLSLFSCAGQRPDNLGPQDGRLASCPDSPNCVSSSETRDSHYIAPLQTDIETLSRHLETLDNAEIITRRPDYLHAEFRSRIMGFIDDVEFLAAPDGGTQVRSASRLGHSDLGVNRKRIEAIRAAIGS